MLRARKLGTMVLIAVGAALGLWLFAAVLLPLLLPLFIGLAVAELAKKPVGVLQKKSGLPRGLCSFVCVLGLYAAFGAGAFLLCRLLCRQVGGFLHQLPELAGRLEEPAKALQTRLYAIADKFPDGVGSGLRAGLTSFFESGAALGAKLYEKLFLFASGFLGRLPDLVLGAVTAVLSSFMFSSQLSQLQTLYVRHVPPRLAAEALEGTHAPVHDARRVAAGARKAHGRNVSDSDGRLFLPARGVRAFVRASHYDHRRTAGLRHGDGADSLEHGAVSAGRHARGVGLLLLYAVAALTRQALEPRLLGGSLGLPAGGDAGSALRGLPRDGCGRNDRFSAAGGLLLPALPVHHRAHAGRSAGIL